MAVVVRIVLAFALLFAHTPVCKGAAVPPRTQIDSSRTEVRKPCCGKCARQVEPQHTQTPKPRPPVKPSCPTGSECALCGAPVAVVPDATPVVELAAPVVAELVESGRGHAADGFHTLLDRPPRG